MDDLLWQTLNSMLETAIRAAVPVLIGMAVVAVKRYADQLKARIGEQRWYQAEGIVRANVLAAEQLGLIDEALRLGAAKKEWVLTRSQAALDERGIKIPLVDLVALVESLVYSELTAQKSRAGLPASARLTGAG